MMIQLLQSLGFNAIKENSKGYLYISPFSINEKTPSFYVLKNTKGECLNYKCWSSSKGGDIYNFIMEYYHLDFKSAKSRLNAILNHNYTKTQKHEQKHEQKPTIPMETTYKIISITDIQKQYLKDYLLSRAIIFSFNQVKEITYQITNKDKSITIYTALSFVNDSKGYEVRNKYFKGSFGTKDISFIKSTNHSKNVKIFEGFMDYLSYLNISTIDINHYDVIVLNSTALINKAMKILELKQYNSIELYFDNDKSGSISTDEVLKVYPNAIDKRATYKNFNDVNDYIISLKK
jgi:DNA primase